MVLSPAQAPRLEAELTGLGFRRVARHKSKDVDLYRQNDVNIVVNREQDGFAHSFYLVHGASVCAIALRFDDPARALERANALAAPTYHGRIGPGEAGVYEAVRLTIQGRDCTMDVMEVPDGTPVLIGQVPLELLDFVVDMTQHALIGNPRHNGEFILDMF